MSAVATSAVQPGVLGFGNARDCKTWLKSIPLTNLSQAQMQVRDALRALNQHKGFDPIERLTCLELLRDKVAFFLEQQRSRVLGKAIPLATHEYANLQAAAELAAEMEAGYQRCWQEAQSAIAPLGAHAALILQRSIRYLGAQMALSVLIFRSVEGALWLRLHNYWNEAERHGLTDKRVKDSQGTVDGYSGVQQAYVEALLTRLANGYAMNARQADFAEGVLKRFSHKVTVTPLPAGAGPFCTVDLGLMAGAELHTRVDPSPDVRLLDIQEFSRSLRRRLKKLMEGEEPGKLDLPTDWSTQEALTQLTRLHRCWCECGSAMDNATVPEVTDVAVLFGLAEIDYFLRGDLFEQPGAKRELTREEMRDIQMFGRVTDSTTRGRAAVFQFASDNWKIVDQTDTLIRLMRPAQSARGVAMGKLLGLRVKGEKNWRLAVIRELLEEPVGYIIVTVEMLPGTPQNVAVRSADVKNRASPQWTQALLLPVNEALKLPEALVIPSNLAKKGGEIDTFYQGNARKRVLNAFVERGADFDCVIAT